MALQVVEHGLDARVVTMTGVVDTLTAPQLANFLAAQLVDARLLVLDLDGVQFMGSAGLSVLVEATDLATRQDRTLRLVCNSPSVNRAMEVTGLRENFLFADTVPDALRDLS